MNCTDTSFTDTAGLSGNKTYYYKIKAFSEDLSSTSDYSQYVSVTTPASAVPEPAPAAPNPAPAAPNPAPAAPNVPKLNAPSFAVNDAITISKNEQGVTLLWNAVAGAESYKIYRANTKNTANYTYLDAISARFTAYDDLSVNIAASGGAYYYTVTAVNSSGVESDQSAPRGFIVTKPVVYGYNPATSGSKMLYGCGLDINNMIYSSASTAILVKLKREGDSVKTQSVSLNPGTYSYKTRYLYIDGDSKKGSSWKNNGTITIKPLFKYKINCVSGSVTKIANLTVLN
jgi:hypothetical protein